MSRRKPVGLAILGAFLAALVGLDVLGFLSGAEHHGGFWNSVPLGDLVLGMAGAQVLVWFARRILKPLLSRPEHYYDGDNSPS